MTASDIYLLLACILFWAGMLYVAEGLDRRRRARRDQVEAGVRLVELRHYRPINSKGM